jgi:hypothetical protein
VEVHLYSFLTSVIGVYGHLQVPAAIPPGNNHRFPLNKWLGGPQNGRNCLEKREIMTFSGIEPIFFESLEQESSKFFAGVP